MDATQAYTCWGMEEIWYGPVRDGQFENARQLAGAMREDFHLYFNEKIADLPGVIRDMLELPAVDFESLAASIWADVQPSNDNDNEDDEDEDDEDEDNEDDEDDDNEFAAGLAFLEAWNDAHDAAHAKADALGLVDSEYALFILREVRRAMDKYTEENAG